MLLYNTNLIIFVCTTEKALLLFSKSNRRKKHLAHFEPLNFPWPSKLKYRTTLEQICGMQVHAPTMALWSALEVIILLCVTNVDDGLISIVGTFNQCFFFQDLLFSIYLLFLIRKIIFCISIITVKWGKSLLFKVSILFFHSKCGGNPFHCIYNIIIYTI